MPNVNYVGVGKNGGSNSELEQAKTEALQLANQMTRTKLLKLQGELVEKRIVSFVLSHALATIREQILRLPQLISAELRGFDYNVAHDIRMRSDGVVRRSLEELAETLAQAVHAEDFLAGLDGGDVAEESDAQRISRELKRDRTNEKRRAKYAKRNKST